MGMECVVVVVVIGVDVAASVFHNVVCRYPCLLSRRQIANAPEPDWFCAPGLFAFFGMKICVWNFRASRLEAVTGG